MFEVVRRGDFLHASRVRAWLTIAAIVSAGAVLGGVALSRSGIDPAGRPLGTDFVSFWAAARLAIAGPVAAVWDVARHAAEQVEAFGASDGFAVFFYPPVFLVFVWPLGALPYMAALAVWSTATGAAAFVALRAWAGAWARGWTGGLAFVGFPAVFIVLGHGQNAFLTTAIFAATGVLAGRRPLLAGMVAGLLVFKPQMAVMLPIAFLAAGRPRVVVGMAASAAGLIAASLAAFGTASWLAFAKLAPAVEATMALGLFQTGKMVSVRAGLQLVGVASPTALAVHAASAVAVAIAVAVVCRRARSVDAAVAVAAAATPLISPFLFDYDLMLLAVPMAWLVRRGLATGFGDWERAAILAAFVLPGIARSLALALAVPIAPPVLFALLWVVSRRAMAEGRTDAPSQA